jgi:ligand-binding sensor domain-containing protein
MGQSKPVALGQWRLHLPYNNVKQIVEVKDKLFCAGTHGFFYLEKKDGSTTRLSPINGFGGYEVETMQYDKNKDILVIAYADTKIELLKGKTIVKNDDIFQKTIIGNKSINHINIHQDIAYLSTSFGLLELNIDKNEIRNSYQNIGPGGTTIEIFSSSVLNDSLYISTKFGIYRGKIASTINLADYNNWQLVKAANFASKHICSYNQKLYAELDSQVWVYENKDWNLLETYDSAAVTNINVYHNQLLIGVYNKHIIKINGNNKTYQPIKVLSHCILDDREQIWYSSPIIGVVLQNQNGEVNFFPNGPKAINAYQMINAFDKFYVMGGTFKETNYAPNFNKNGFYLFDNYTWTYSDPSNPLIQPMYDFTLCAYQKNTGRLYLGSHGTGILQINNGQAVKRYDETNSPLRKRGGLFNIISGMALDKSSNLWVSNFDVDSSLHQLNNKGEWTSYKLPVNNTSKIAIDSRNNKWIVVQSGGLLFFNDKGTNTTTDDIISRVNANSGTGNLPSNNVNDIAFTKNGELLIGTDQGFVRIRNPNAIQTGGNYDAERIIVSLEQGTNLGGYVLETERINTIFIDGGDRRWFGTDKGAWLYDSDGTTLLHHFTKENSPLISNNVFNIGINETTGEVFFGTDKGLISFRADANAAAKSIEKLVIYPNPVRPDFVGDVAITGLTENTLIKITDINGQLVYQTFSNGGMATWNCKTFSGERPSTGVYLVFAISNDGEETEVGKLLFIK